MEGTIQRISTIKKFAFMLFPGAKSRFGSNYMYPRGGGNIPGGIVLGGNFLWGLLSGGNCPWGQLSWGDSPGAIVWGGGLSSGGNSLGGGNCAGRGGNCPVTIQSHVISITQYRPLYGWIQFLFVVIDDTSQLTCLIFVMKPRIARVLYNINKIAYIWFETSGLVLLRKWLFNYHFLELDIDDFQFVSFNNHSIHENKYLKGVAAEIVNHF